MQLYQRGKSGIWWLRFTTPDHQRVRVSTGTASKKAAREFADRLKADSWRVGKLGDKPRRSWQEAVVRFLEETRHKRSHGEDIAKLRWLDPQLGSLMLDQIKADNLAEIRRLILAGKGPNGGSSHGTANKYLALIRSILRKAEREWEWLEKAPAVRLHTGHAKKAQFRWLKHEAASRLLDALRARQLFHTADMARFTLATGLRESNVTGLTWDRVDLARRAAWIESEASKSGHAISAPLNDDAVEVLRRCRSNHPTRVFVYRGKPITKASTRGWREALVAEGLRPKPGRHPENFCWHDLRHTWASWHVMAGTPLEVLQQLGGWRSLDMVLRYAHLAPGHVAAYSSNVLFGTNLAQVEKTKISATGESPSTH